MTSIHSLCLYQPVVLQRACWKDILLIEFVLCSGATSPHLRQTKRSVNAGMLAWMSWRDWMPIPFCATDFSTIPPLRLEGETMLGSCWLRMITFTSHSSRTLERWPSNSVHGRRLNWCSFFGVFKQLTVFSHRRCKLFVSSRASVSHSHALHVACMNNAYEVVKALLETGPAAFNGYDSFRFTPLMVAAIEPPKTVSRKPAFWTFCWLVEPTSNCRMEQE